MVYSNDPIEYYKEKRKQIDPIMQLIHLSSALVWIMLISILFITNRAMPPLETVFDRYLGVELRNHWDFRILGMIQWILAAVFIMSGIGIILNTRRLKRATDHMRVSLIISAVFSFIGSIVMFFIMR